MGVVGEKLAIIIGQKYAALVGHRDLFDHTCKGDDTDDLSPHNQSL